MCICIRGIYRAAGATMICLVTTAAMAQPPEENPFGAPLGEAEEQATADQGPTDTSTSTEDAAAEQDAILESAQKNTPVYWADEPSKLSARIRRALSEPLHGVGIEVKDAPLNEVVNFIEEDHQIAVRLDLSALDDLGLKPDEPVTATLRHISLGSALQLLLRPLELTYFIDNEVLVISTEEEALTRLKVAVYPVGDLLAVKAGYEHDSTTDDKFRRPEDMDTLVDLIISTVASDTWVENGGPEAEIRAMQPGLLVISQTRDVHEEIAQLLLALRQAKAHPAAMPHRGMSQPERQAEVEARMRAHSEGAEQDQGGGGAF